MRFRSIFISDTHLGTADCRAEHLLEFLQKTQSDHLYLVGDIIDLWRLRNHFYWPVVNTQILHALIERARSGCRISYIPGNHDAPLRDFAGGQIHGIEIKSEDIHVTADGNRLLVVHGDMFDEIVLSANWAYRAGTNLYDMLMVLNRLYNRARRLFGYPHWSLATFIKCHIKEALKHIENFEEAAAHEASTRGFNGIICGHIHHPNHRVIHGTLYLNTGDWVERCTALVEDFNGRIRLLNWLDAREHKDIEQTVRQAA